MQLKAQHNNNNNLFGRDKTLLYFLCICSYVFEALLVVEDHLKKVVYSLCCIALLQLLIDAFNIVLGCELDNALLY